MMGAQTGGFAIEGQQFHVSCVLHEYLIGLKHMDVIVVGKSFQCNPHQHHHFTNVVFQNNRPVTRSCAKNTAAHAFTAMHERLQFPEKSAVRMDDSALVTDLYLD